MPHRVSPRVVNLVCVIVTVVWFASFVLEAALPTFDAPPGVQELMMVMVGIVFAGNATRSGGGDAKKPEPESSKPGEPR